MLKNMIFLFSVHENHPINSLPYTILHGRWMAELYINYNVYDPVCASEDTVIL